MAPWAVLAGFGLLWGCQTPPTDTSPTEGPTTTASKASPSSGKRSVADEEYLDPHANPDRWFVQADSPIQDAQLLELLDSIRETHPVPGIALAVLDGSTLVAQAASGTRRADHPAPVTTQDRWHLGSDTKAMTATLAAGLIAEGALSWKTTLAEAFPDHAPTMDPALREVTFHDLMCHRGGFPAIPTSDGMWGELFQFEGTDRQARQSMLEVVLHEPPAVSPGEFLYSNTGYMVAGAILEAVTNRSWQELMQTRLFAPLGMTQVGFGPPVGTPSDEADSPGAPWGHAAPFGKLKPMDPRETDSDNPSSLGPAGTVHATMADWCRFLRVHLAGARKEPQPIQLAKNGFRFLHTPWKRQPNDDAYACGFGIVTDPDLGRGSMLQHAGSNTMWFAVFVIAPRENFAIAVAANAASADAQAACKLAVDEAADWLRNHRASR